MRRGMLSGLFSGVVPKRLTEVETITPRSNQHEFQGTKPLRRLLDEGDRRRIPTRFVWIAAEQDALAEDGFMSWSNVRKGKPRAAEYHLYYSTNAVTEAMRPGDALFLALRQDGSILVVVTPSETTCGRLAWLFGLPGQLGLQFAFQPVDAVNDTELDFAARYILDELGIEPEELEAEQIDELIASFGLAFPTTRIFSQRARESLLHVSARDDPDRALIEWIEREEQMFRRLERRIVAARIAGGFEAADTADVDGFLAFSLSVQNRRKARAGRTLENHLEAIFSAHNIRCVRGAETEHGNRPDFLFPGPAEYQDPAFPDSRLTMLGAKSTLKERWRQVLSEAERIGEKHLLTLEPGISPGQTTEMQAKRLRLVVPRGLHATYRAEQRTWLMDAAGFLRLVCARQRG